MAKHDDQNDKRPLSKLESLFGKLRPKTEEEPEPEMVTVKEEKKRVKRVVKPKPMSRQHLSESFNTPAITKEDIAITESVMRGVAPSVATPIHENDSEPSFACLECGAQVPISAERCPTCNTLYVRDLTEEQLIELESTEDETQADEGDVLSKEDVPCIHFNPESGTISYLENDTRRPDFEVECSKCGTLIGFDTDRCPICGTKFEVVDTGIVGLFAHMEFDNDCAGEMDCPLCGERIVPVNGMCPSCKEMVHEDDPQDPDINVEPVIRNENVVFMHLDVESGEVNYLQRLARRLGFEQLTVKLDGIGRGGFEHETDWKSLSRI